MLFRSSLPAKIKKALPEATDFVDIIERIDLALQDGQPVDEVVDYVLNLTKIVLSLIICSDSIDFFCKESICIEF